MTKSCEKTDRTRGKTHLSSYNNGLLQIHQKRGCSLQSQSQAIIRELRLAHQISVTQLLQPNSADSSSHFQSRKCLALDLTMPEEQVVVSVQEGREQPPFSGKPYCTSIPYQNKGDQQVHQASSKHKVQSSALDSHHHFKGHISAL